MNDEWMHKWVLRVWVDKNKIQNKIKININMYNWVPNGCENCAKADELWWNRTGRTWWIKGEDKLGSLHHDLADWVLRVMRKQRQQQQQPFWTTNKQLRITKLPQRRAIKNVFG